MIEELVKQFERVLVEAATRIADGAATIFANRMQRVLKSEIKLVYNKQEAADFLRVSVSTIENLIKTDAMGYYK